MKRFNLILTVFAVLMVFSCATTETVDKSGSYGFQSISIAPKNVSCKIVLKGPGETILVPGDYVINSTFNITGAMSDYVFDFKINGSRPPENLVKVSGKTIMALTRVRDGEVKNISVSISPKSGGKGFTRQFSIKGKFVEEFDVENIKKSVFSLIYPVEYDMCQAPVSVLKDGELISKYPLDKDGLKIKTALMCDDVFDLKYNDLDETSIAELNFMEGCDKPAKPKKKNVAAKPVQPKQPAPKRETSLPEAPKEPELVPINFDTPPVINVAHIWNTNSHSKRYNNCPSKLVFSSESENINQDCRFIVIYDNDVRKEVRILPDGSNLNLETEGDGGCTITVTTCR